MQAAREHRLQPTPEAVTSTSLDGPNKIAERDGTLSLDRTVNSGSFTSSRFFFFFFLEELFLL